MNLHHVRPAVDAPGAGTYSESHPQRGLHERNAVPIATRIQANLYKDSVALLRIAQQALARDGVTRATLQMGTPANKAILANAGLLDAQLEAARPADVMIAVQADTQEVVEEALAAIARALEGERGTPASGAVQEIAPRSIAMARDRLPQAALAQVSVPGPYAAAEAMKALRRGLHVFLFSDNVPLEQEREIKALATRKGLLVMGPDCGTAIIGGVPLGFANRVRRGAIGLVGASGTGLQEVSCRIDALGQGISHAIGTGGRDVREEIGGATMLQAIELLAADAGTQVIGIVSKPPAPAVARRVIEALGACGKPAVVLFLGADLSAQPLPASVTAVDTLEDAAAACVARVTGQRFAPGMPGDDDLHAAQAEARRLARGQRNIRGLFSGGTFATEAKLLWKPLGSGHAAIDLGDDEFTVGRPHPMIDPSLRLERIASDAADPETAVIVLDVVLGYAAHDDPAGVLRPVIVRAQADAARAGRHLSVVAFVCGTEADPQSLARQQQVLRDAGAIVAAGSTAAARLAAEIALRAATQARPVATLEEIR
jgi:FdrA protein